MSGGYESSDRQVDELKPPPWRCDVHHLQVPGDDCPKCDAELIALTEQAADPCPESVGHGAGELPEADPTAGERHTCDSIRHAEGCAACQRAAEPDAGDADYWRGRFERMRLMYRERFNGGLSNAEWHAKHCAAARALADRREPDAGDVEALACIIDRFTVHDRARRAARAVLASDWLAADRAATAERIAQAIEAERIEAALAAIPTPLATTGPVDWDSPAWGGGRHEAAWAPDGTHDDNAQDD